MSECKHVEQRRSFWETFIKDAELNELKDRERHFKTAAGWRPDGPYARQKFMQVYRQMTLAELRRRNSLGS